MIGDGTITSNKLTVIGSATEEGIYLDNTADGVDLQISPDQDQPDFMTFRTTTGSGIIFHGQEDVSALVINATNNNLGTGGSCLDPDHDLIIGGSGAGCDTGTYSEIDAGEGSFTVSSSRTLKENFNLVSVPNILDLIAQVPVYTYDFKQSACSTGDCKDKMGLIAEDFHTIFGRGSDKQINGQEMTMALWLGMQALNNKVAQLEVTSIKADMDSIKLTLADIKGEITSIKADIAGIKDRLNNLEDTITKKNVPVTEGATEYKVEWPTPFDESDYGAWVTPNWITGFAIKDKKPDSFMILFEVPAPAGATIDYKAEK